eukprot:TRINITY_DN7686_c0_g1_i1.p1 TRINITY_DN7686_c0_g1~~TRINITY_DN7686_c0_g1_i1.p1  ORF type:complete len:442 (-),score=132.87 TRINITY_DN7686_c0_g1_i1:298-1587(-)
MFLVHRSLARSSASPVRPRAALRPQAQRRHLNVHEYQAQQILRNSGLPVAKGITVETPKEAVKAAQVFHDFFGKAPVVIKAQVLAGGRGKGHFDNGLEGGVHITDDLVKIQDLTEKMLGHRLITKQTGAAGKPCNVLYMVEKMDIIKETYVAIVLDRATGGPVLVASSEGGMDIEAVAAKTPELIHRIEIDPKAGLPLSVAVDLAEKIGFTGESAKDAGGQFIKLYEYFWANDATQIEINPFAELKDGRVMCLDAKFNFDDNALFKHPEIAAMRDLTQEDARDVKAAEHDINYIGLKGNIGCMVNGAGLAMATMDIIKLKDGAPANFLDIGGGASEEQVTHAFKLLNADPQVKCILVNIFGGIMRCDVIAAGIVKACQTLNLTTPVVVRLQGTNFAEGQKIIEESGLKLWVDDDLESAAEKAVALAAKE